MNPVRLSVVVVSWNTRDLLARCLASVYEDARRWAGLALQILVVDNASVDGSAQMVRDQFPGVRLLANQDNVGFARANNQALRLCVGEYAMLLNPDTEVRPGALTALVDFMRATPEAGAAGARLVESNGTLQPSCSPAPTLSREFWRMFHLDAVWPYAVYPQGEWDLATPHRVDTLKGACLIVRGEALTQVGLFDEDYFIYSEEVDLCQRLRRAGWRLFWQPRAVVVHHGGQSTRQEASAMFLRLYQAKILYFRKHHGLLATWLYKLILFAAALPRLALAPLIGLVRASDRQHHLALVARYGRLIRALPGY